MILQVTRSLQAIQPGGEGHSSAIRVRLLHAAVRRKIVKLAQSHPEYYNVKEYGVPINNLDCIATIVSFSSSMIWISMPRQGIIMRQQEILDYIALWRYIAYLMGTPTEPFETPKKAKMAMEMLLYTEVNPSETSRALAGNVIRGLVAQPPTFASQEFLEANSRWLNGKELSDELGLSNPGPYYWILVAGQCLFFMAICYAYRSISWLDRKKIEV